VAFGTVRIVENGDDVEMSLGGSSRAWDSDGPSGVKRTRLLGMLEHMAKGKHSVIKNQS
jgi:hypothetical protein